MVAANFDTINELKNQLIRKALSYAVFAADVSAPAVIAPFDVGGVLQELPVGYRPIGFTTDDGVQFSGDYSVSEVTSGQSAKPTRSDVETDTMTAQWTPQETNAATVALFENLPLTQLGGLGAAWNWKRPMVPATIYRRLLFIARDTAANGVDPIYIVRHMPRALRTGRGDEQWSRTAELTREVTFTGYHDEVRNTDCETWIDGAGWRALATATGTNEVQSVAITGGPTGGTYTLTFSGQTTAGIAYNATAAAVQAALEALTNIAPGDVVCAGGPHPGTAVSVTFGGQYAGVNVAEMTASAAGLTGGAAPAVTVTTTTPGGP
jgi:hypothetical protein